MMKKLLNPEIEFVRFGTKDIFTTSGGEIPFDGGQEKTPGSGSQAEDKGYGGLVINQ